MSVSLHDQVALDVEKVLPEVVAFRRARHQAPELTWQEEATAAAVAHELQQIPGIEVTQGVGRLGVVGLLRGPSAGPCVALRADMDALPVEEKTGVSYSSRNSGVMHACGHDGHMANLLGAAKILSKRRADIKGSVKFIFQPAEEGGAGALQMCDDGVLENPKVDVIFGLHGWPQQEVGKIFVMDGAMMAAQTGLKIKISGKGGHAGLPHLSTDQILTGARIVEALQQVASRFVAPTDPVVLTISTFHGGKASNVIPDTVELSGTLRTLSLDVQQRVLQRIKEIVEGVAQVHGAVGELEIIPGYPPTINHTVPTDFVLATAEKVLGTGAANRMSTATMGAEDFSYFLERCPGSFFFLGVDDGRAGGYPSLHHPHFDFNDDALPAGIKMFANLALDWADAHTVPQ